MHPAYSPWPGSYSLPLIGYFIRRAARHGPPAQTLGASFAQWLLWMQSLRIEFQQDPTIMWRRVTGTMKLQTALNELRSCWRRAVPGAPARGARREDPRAERRRAPQAHHAAMGSGRRRPQSYRRRPERDKARARLAFELAVAAGCGCLGRFAVPAAGPVLAFSAEGGPITSSTASAAWLPSRPVCRRTSGTGRRCHGIGDRGSAYFSLRFTKVNERLARALHPHMRALNSLVSRHSRSSRTYSEYAGSTRHASCRSLEVIAL